MKKKTIMILSVFLIILCFAFPAQAASKKTKALKAYKKYLEKYEKDCKKDGFSTNAFGIAYINNDNIPDLVMYRPEFPSMGKPSIYTYKKNKVVCLSLSPASCYYTKYYKKKGAVISVLVKDDNWNYRDYSFFDFKKTGTDSVSHNISFALSQEDGKYYKFNLKSDKERKQITKKEFNSLLKKKVGKAKAKKIKYHKNTKKNRNKYLK